ncbi:CpsD/CapB family tyrosine-protein kinase [Clostridium pasteurianum]|uniref:non-specific protein-tyrosine kinase n=1 Tax=Clostridium pasteurianum BC1 TaxID=86416 RepID=R4K8A4_CLOPA|nr:CpsD/CapB family tyrosine-protein kinase [Clostridium pasteurianum]AGK95870.1 capsular exopolysaccharide biosynthesis protein [Clostridium pasteurianum BC1]
MLIFKDKPKSSISEGYRTLRNNIQFFSLDNNIKALLITSSSPCEGKSTVASNLALSIAELNNKVLILDCDLRRPSIHKKFHLSDEKGLSNLLIGEYKFNEVVQKYNDNLYILTSGTIPPNPSEMLSSNKMKDFLTKVKEDFDYIILDTSPVVSLSDVQALATLADGVLLVLASGESEITEVNKAIKLLSYVKANIIGIVANKLKYSRKSIKKYNSYYNKDIKI